MTITQLFPSVACGVSFIAGAAEPKAPAEPPVTFLQTDIQAWQRILATEITADFRSANIREVIDYIGRLSRANIVLSLDVAARPAAAHVSGTTSQAKELPTITCQFQSISLRTVLYRISQDTGLTIDWLYEKSVPRAIRIRNQ